MHFFHHPDRAISLQIKFKSDLLFAFCILIVNENINLALRLSHQCWIIFISVSVVLFISFSSAISFPSFLSLFLLSAAIFFPFACFCAA